MSNEHYELRRMPLAHGVMGDVWQGRDLRRRRDVAVKFPRVPAGADRDEMSRWFAQETRAMAAVRHPGVPAVLDSGVDDGRPFMVMRLVRGRSLSDLLAGHGRLPACWVAEIGAQACAALAAVHEAGLVHGDIDPANIMMEPDGTVLLVDFGLAAAVGNVPKAPAHVVDLPAYAAPELRFGSSLTAATDLYALGRTLRELLIGRPGDAQAVPTDIPTTLAATVEALTLADYRRRPATATRVGRDLAWQATHGDVGQSALPAGELLLTSV